MAQNWILCNDMTKYKHGIIKWEIAILILQINNIWHQAKQIFVGKLVKFQYISLVKKQKAVFCIENSDIFQNSTHNACNYTDLITFGKELLENKQILYEGLAIETSNAQNAMFSFKTKPL